MTTAAWWAFGSALQLGDGATPEVFTSIAEIIELDIEGFERDEINVTSHQSPDGWEEIIGQLRRTGKITVKANWLPTDSTHAELWEQFANDDANHNYRILLPSDIGYISVRGFAKSYKPTLPLEEQGQLEVEIRLSGKPTMTLN
jgi:predicted secreted protein